MAYVVARPGGSWELRESRATARGPRARTLATFRTLTPQVIEHARARSAGPLDDALVRAAALRAGAPVGASAPDRAAGELLAQLDSGQRPRPALARLLLHALQSPAPGSPDHPRHERAGDGQPLSDSARAAAAWVASSAQSRGETLRDLLLLADRLPAPRTPAGRRFPRLRSAPA